MKKGSTTKSKSNKVTATTTRSAAPAKPTPVRCREITSELIASRAYSIWEQKGRPQGSELENWLLAEQQLKQETQAFSA